MHERNRDDVVMYQQDLSRHMKYEMMYVIPATKTDDEVKVVQEEITALIGQHAAELTRNESLGKRKLAYPIKHVRYGYYVLTCFDAEPGALKELDQEMRHNTSVLRHMIVAAKANADTVAVELEEYEVPDVYARRKRGPKKAQKPEAAPAPKTDETQKEGDKPKPELSQEQLDKKIDDILEGDIDKA